MPVPERRFFVTGNATFEQRIPLLVLIPHSQVEWLLQTFFGALDYMADVDSWYTGGETDPIEAAEIFREVFNTAHTIPFLIGMINDFAYELPLDSGWLPCDGFLYPIDDFPDLYQAIGTTYNQGGDPSDSFRVPDLRGRVRATINSGETRLPSWADAAGGTGGESEHTLSVIEMPAHSHTDAGHIHTSSEAGPNATTIGPGVPEPTAVPVPLAPTSSGNANIQDTGGDGPHNNVQPTMAMFAYILAEF